MISHKYRCIYLFNPKTASSSIRSYFWTFLKGYSFDTVLRGSKYAGIGFQTRLLNMFPTYFTFTFVRNPFDRFVSTWLHRFDRNRNQFNPTMDNHSLREYVELTKDVLIHRSSLSFSSDREMGPYRVPFHKLGFERAHLRHQKDFLLDYNPEYYFGVKRCNSAPSSFIGRYENLERDFSCLLDILDAPNHKLGEHNISLSRKGRSKFRHYSYYYDTPTKRLVEEIYADDLELLGYDFEEAGKVSIPKPLYDGSIARLRHADSMKLSVIGMFKSYRLRIILLTGLFNERAILIKHTLLVLFIYPILTFFGLYNLVRRVKRYLMGQTNSK